MRNLLIGRLLIVAMIVAAAPGYAGDCKKTGSVCVDSTPCKTVSGQQVCLSQFGLSCWEYEDTYTCIKPNAVNYCQPFVNAQPQCWQTNSQCSQWDSVLNTGCMKYTQTWRCNDPNFPTPSNTVTLNDTYTLVSSGYNTAPCQSLDTNPNCSIAESKCVSTTPPSPLPPGISSSQVAPDGCYQKQNTYACLTGRVDSSECDGYASNPNCTFQSSTCDPDPAYTVNGQCTSTTKTYKCMSAPSKTNTVTDCSGQLFCQDGKCFDKGYENDPDFARTMALMEAAREAGTYMDPNSMQIFKGFDSRCRIKLFGLANCCKKSGGGAGMSNASMALNAGIQAGKFFGSPYMYDAMFASDIPWLVDKAVDAWNATAWTSTTSFYGLQFSFSTTTGLQFVGFDPYSFAFQIGMMILQDLMSCEQSEQILAMRRGQNLCHEVGTYCSKKLPVVKTCIEKTKSYCCFNSRLARIINEQGRAQIGKGWGSGESPNCSGFTQSEFEAIDFSRIDLSEFMSEVMANIKMPDVGSMGQQVQSAVQQKVQNYYQRGIQ
jgi:conjugal transfer mating pair stabilization protein TraN